MKRVAEYCGYIVKLNILREIENRAGILAWGLLVIIQSFSNLWLLSVLASKFHAINGWTIEQLLFMYGLSQVSHGAALTFFIQTWSLEEYIVHGTLDRMIVRPIYITVQFLTDHINFIGLFNLLTGIIVFVYAGCRVHFACTASNLIQLFFIIVAGMLIEGSVYWIIGSLSFWFKRTNELTKIYTQVTEKIAMYPLTIFPGMVRVLFFTIIPYAYIAYLPTVSYFQSSGESFQVNNTCIIVLVAGVLIALAYGIFHRGLRRYESAC